MAGFVKAQAQNFLGTDTTNKVVQKWGNVAQKVDKAAQKVYEKTGIDIRYSDTVKIAELPDVSEDSSDIRPKLDAARLAKTLRGMENYQVMVVSIAGEFRSGKSFLLNLMTTYLDFLCKGKADQWINSNIPIKGIQWARSMASVTHGLWMWSEPFVLKRKDSKVAVLLVDCQGTGDVKQSSSTLDTLITYISLQLSNVQIINLKGQMKSDDLTRLQMCTTYADALSDDDTGLNISNNPEHLFNRLIYLQRNWECDESYGERPDDEFNSLITDRNISAEVRKAGTGLQKAFRKVTTFCLPHPGRKVTKADEMNAKGSVSNHGSTTLKVTDDDIDKDFLDSAKTLFDNIFMDLEGDRHFPIASEVIHEFELLEERIASTGISISSPEVSLNETLAYRAFNEASSFFNKKVEQEITREYLSEATDSEIEAQMNRIWQETETTFKERYRLTKFGPTPAFVRFHELLSTAWMYNCSTQMAVAKAIRAENQLKKKRLMAIKFYEAVEQQNIVHASDIKEEREREKAKIKEYKKNERLRIKAEIDAAAIMEQEKKEKERAKKAEELEQKLKDKKDELRGRLLKMQQQIEEEANKAQVEYKIKLEEIAAAEKEAERERMNAEAKAEEEARLRQNSPFLKGLKKVGLGAAGVLLGIVGVALSPILLPTLGVMALLRANKSDESDDSN